MSQIHSFLVTVFCYFCCRFYDSSSNIFHNLFASRLDKIYSIWRVSGGNFLYIVVYKDVRKIWGGFFDSDHKYGCGILVNIINMGRKFVIFRLKNIDSGAKFD